VLAVLAPATAGARTLHVATSVHAGYLELPGPGFEVDGVTSGSLHGAVSSHEVLTGSSFSGTFLYIDGRGTLRGSDHAPQQAPVGTTMPFTDTITITNGTGAYRGAHGSLTSQGSADITTGFFSERMNGTLTTGRAARQPRPLTRPAPYNATANVIGAVPGPTVTAVGRVRGLTPPGGIIVLHSRQGAIEGAVSYTYYDGLGTISGSVNILSTVQQDGTIALTKLAGASAHGTGRYAHVTSLRTSSFSGTRDPATRVVTISFKGRMRVAP
jgi:hypothetical protein